jgi:hypothetical protein
MQRIHLPYRRRASRFYMHARSTCINGNIKTIGTDTDCVSPTQPGGSLVVGSGKETNFTAIQTNNATVTITKDTPDQICFKLVVDTGVCMVDNVADALATAVERYPATLESK